MFLGLSGAPLVIVAIIAFILVIGVIITVHELGHLIFAKRAGILCHEFSIGFGPIIYKHQFKETLFCIRAIPIGGYVSMADESTALDFVKVGDNVGININDDIVNEIILDENAASQIRGEVTAVDLFGEAGEDLFITIKEGENELFYKVRKDAFYVFEKNKRMQITPYDRCLQSKTKWQRFLTLVAGSMMNLLLAIFVCIIVGLSTGVPNYESSIIGSVGENSSAYNVLKENDQITHVKSKSGDIDKDIKSWDDFSKTLASIYENYETSMYVTVKRGSENLTFELEASTYIVSIGISNLYLEESIFDDKVDGLKLGAIAIRYNDQSKTFTYPLASGDYITKMKVETIKDNKVVNTEEKELDSWSDIVMLMEDEDYCRVYFEYYSQAKYNEAISKLANKDEATYELGLVTIEDLEKEYKDKNLAIESYTKEVLETQGIEAIQQKLGVSPTYKFDFFGSLGNAFKEFWGDFTYVFKVLKVLIAPSGVRQVGVKNLSSFVGIFSLIEDYVASGFIPLLSFVALLSVNIGLVNLLPIPALDGGRILFLLIELITRKKVPRKVENIINNVVFVLVLILLVYVTYNDIVRLIHK